MEPKVKAENFMRGALLITFGALISRILGAIYRPVGQHFLGDVGLDLATPPAVAYQVLLQVSVVGLNVAISRFVSERLALQDYRGARHVVRVATMLLLISGLSFSLLFAASAGWLATVQGYPDSKPGFLALAPAILLVTITCAYRGLYQGMQQMRPSAVSQVVEQGARVFFGIAMIAALSPIALNYGAAGYNAGNTVGVLLGTLYLAWIYLKQRPMADWDENPPGVVSIEKESTPRLMAKIIAVAVPLSLIGTALPLMGQVDSFLVKNRLEAAGLLMGLNPGALLELTEGALGILFNAGTLRDLPSILTAALYVSLVPAVTESMANGNAEQARYRAHTALRITLLFGLPATFGLLFGAQAAYSVLYTGTGWTVMGPLAWSTIFLMLQNTTSGVMQGLGLVWVTVRNLLIGVAAKVILTYWWTAIPALMLNGAAYATGVGFALMSVLNLWALYKGLNLRLHWRDDIGRPLAASLLMGLALWLIYPVASDLIPMARLSGLVAIGLGGLVYAVAIFALGGVTEADLHLVPGMRARWIESLKRARLVRS